MDEPIFIVGANRSGTTLLRLILNAHSNIAIPDEIQYFKSRGIARWRQPGMTSEEYARFVRRFLRVNCRSLTGLDVGRLENGLLSYPEIDLRHPYRAALSSWAHLQGKGRWGEKTPGNLFYADVIHDMFPSARFIYIVRDPRAGVSSMMNVPFFPRDVVFNAMNRRKHNMEGRTYLEKYVPGSQRITVRYEDLVTDPIRTINHICTFVRVPFEKQMLQFHVDADRFMNEEAVVTYNVSATRPILRDQKEAWRNYLSKEDIAFVECICREEMLRYGYPPDGVELTLRQKIELLAKEVYWKRMSKKHEHLRQYTVRHAMFARSRSFLRRLMRPYDQSQPASTPASEALSS